MDSLPTFIMFGCEIGRRKGKAVISANIPKLSGPAYIWARLKGPNEIIFLVTNKSYSVKLNASPSSTWTWVKSEETLPLEPGKTEIILTSTSYGSAIDCLVVTDDPNFLPEASPRIRRPILVPIPQIIAKATSPYMSKISWTATDNKFFHHYNLYCGREEQFHIDQSKLIASPDRDAFLDWGLHPGDTLFYRVTVVDFWGNESGLRWPQK